MPWETITFERDSLYEDAWAEPLREIAKRHGISDVALGKICRKLRVPVPGRGYWARQAAGQKLTRKPLRRLGEGDRSTHTVQRYRDPIDDSEIGEDAKALLAREETPGFEVRVPAVESPPHPLVKRFGGILRRSQKKRDTIRYERPCLDVRATGDALERALRIADTVLHALETRGFNIEVTEPTTPPDRHRYGKRNAIPSKTAVHILGSFVEWGIEEMYDSVEVQPKRKQRHPDSWLFPPRPERERRPNGKLALKIKNLQCSGIRQTWGDGKTQRVENCLNAFIVGLISAAERMRIEKLESERRHREWEIQQQRWEEERRQRKLEEARARDLDDRVAGWRHAQDIRAFVEAVEASAVGRGEDVSETSELGRWVQWARDRADRIERDAIDTVLEPPRRCEEGRFDW